MENQNQESAASLLRYFNRRPRIGILSTAGADGQVNAAVINSTRMVDARTVELDIGRSRSLDNLKANPQASYVIVQEGAALMEWKGVRAYLRVSQILESGEKLDAAKAVLEKRLGKAAADSIAATVVFEIIELRPLVDRGQGWEVSIG